MVTGGRRAQLLLIGALLLATVIFGLSFLLNSLLFAGASSTGPTSATVADTDTVNVEVQRGVRSLLVRVNHAQRNITGGDLATVVETNVTRFSHLYAESKAATSSMAASVTYHNDSSTFGRRIVQAGDGEWIHPTTSDPNWEPLDDDAAVGWFTANVNIANTSNDPATVDVSNASAAIAYEFGKNGTNVTVTSDPTWDGPTTTECEATGGRVLLDLYDGFAFNSDCSFDGTGLLADPIESVEIGSGDDIEGRFSIVANRTATDVDQCTTVPAPDDACHSPVVWSANLTVGVTGEQVRYGNAFNLSVYPGAAS